MALRAEELEIRALLSAVVTDKPDYHFGETAHITGTEFGVNEQVQIQITHAPGTLGSNADPQNQPFFVQTDASGNFTADWVIDDPDAGGATYIVSAIGLSSGDQAQATFTDAPSITMLSPTSGPPAGGNTVTFTGTGITADVFPFFFYVVDFGGTVVGATRVNSTTLTATAPAGTGTVPVTVYDIFFGSPTPISSGLTYTYTAATPDVSIAVSPSSVAEDGATNLTYTLTRTGSTASALTVNFSVGGTATFGGVGADYTESGAATFGASSGTATFGIGSSTATVTIDPTADSVVEPDETVVLTLTAGAGYNIVSPSTVTGTITNDDKATLSVDDLGVTEGGGFTFTVTSDKVASQDMTVVVDTADGTATTAGSDYTPVSGMVLTIPAGATQTTLTITVNDDAIVEDNETFTLNLSDAKFNGATDATRVVIGDATGEATIVNDDSETLTIDSPTVIEGTGGVNTMIFTVTSPSAVQGGFTVAFSATNGTADDSDYNVNTIGPLTFAGTAGETQTISVNIFTDAIIENNENFTIALGTIGSTTAVQAAAITSTAVGTGTITDDDSETI